MIYEITFVGRKINAIGEFQKFTVVAIGRDIDEALLSLYDTYEHIQVRGWVRKEQPDDLLYQLC